MDMIITELAVFTVGDDGLTLVEIDKVSDTDHRMTQTNIRAGKVDGCR